MYGEPGEVRSPDVYMTLKARFSSTSSHIHQKFIDFIFVENW